MTEHQGRLRKMRVELTEPVSYFLRLDASSSEGTSPQEFPLNDLIGNSIRLEHTGRIFCCHCLRLTKKSFSQGYCYNCFRKLAETDQCIMSPERCHYDQGTCRDPEWAETHCMQKHIVYLANTSGIKVGITRGDQVPTRWIDQGAVAAIPIAVVSRRQLAGFVEAELRTTMSDRTQWQRMLKNEAPAIDLQDEWESVQKDASNMLKNLQEEHGSQNISFDTTPAKTELSYPHDVAPLKVKTHNFDKTPIIESVLTGIKGQYLVFGEVVLNIRKFTGYEVNFSTFD